MNPFNKKGKKISIKTIQNLNPFNVIDEVKNNIGNFYKDFKKKKRKIK